MMNYRYSFSHTALFCFMLVFFLSGCSEDQAPAEHHLAVTYLEIHEQSVDLKNELPGRISAYYVSEVRPQVGGIILQRLFEEGSYVREGQVLYQIDPALYQAAFDSAKANVVKAEAAANSARLLANRYQKLVKSDAVSKQEYDNAAAEHQSRQADIAAFKAALETARINLHYSKVTAPISGRIGRSSVTAGALVTQGQSAPLAVIQELDKVYVDLSQSVGEVGRMQNSLKAGESKNIQLKLSDGRLYSHTGTLEFYDITVDPTTDMVNIRVTFPNKEGELLPGMYARCVLLEGTYPNVMLIPQKTLSRDAEGNSVVKVLVSQSTAAASGAPLFSVEVRKVTVMRDLGSNWIISHGLKTGDLVLVDGQQKAAPGATVTGSPVPAASDEAQAQ